MRGLTQEQLAGRLASAADELSLPLDWVPTRDIVEKWEAGEKVVSDYHLRLLAVALSVDPRWLIGDPAGEPPKPNRR